MRQLVSFLFVVSLTASCSSLKAPLADVRSPSSLENGACDNDNLCIGQSVIGYIEKVGVGSIPYAGRLKSFEAGLYEIDNDAPCASSNCSVKVHKVFKEAKCMDGVCSGERAVDANGKEYEIRSVFNNGEALADQGNMNIRTYLKTNSLFNECNCLAGACRYDMVSTTQGKRIEIDRIYRNGKVGATSSKVDYSLKDLGFPNECSNDSPCSCTVGKY